METCRRSELPDETVQRMADYHHVAVKHQGVIVLWLRQLQPDVGEFVAARKLIKAMNDAGLVTFIKSDLDDFIAQIKSDPVAVARIEPIDFPL